MIDFNHNAPVQQEAPPAIPAWVQEMHEHFREHGFYRAEDLQRVLGDPTVRVEMPATTELCQLASFREK